MQATPRSFYSPVPAFLYCDRFFNKLICMYACDKYAMQTDINNVRKCTGTLYDYTDKNGRTRNFLLEQEVRQQREDNIFTIPTIIINNEPYRGGYTCPHPPQLASCGVLSAVCSAFVNGKEPPACRTDYCWDQVDDCGTVRGRALHSND